MYNNKANRENIINEFNGEVYEKKQNNNINLETTNKIITDTNIKKKIEEFFKNITRNVLEYYAERIDKELNKTVQKEETPFYK